MAKVVTSKNYFEPRGEAFTYKAIFTGAKSAITLFLKTRVGNTLPELSGNPNHMCAAVPELSGSPNHMCMAVPELSGSQNHMCAAIPELSGSQNHMCAGILRVSGSQNQEFFPLIWKQEVLDIKKFKGCYESNIPFLFGKLNRAIVAQGENNG